ncbi:MAG: MotA/TolQ/ExbB proton channel family protein [Nitrospirae bacterium]|nr:MotA/TolQ/ExbB proton channel family protein [Nitrospirota bacterium]
MDIATSIGVGGGVILIIVSILLGSPLSAFFNLPAVIIVVGGTLMATLTTQKTGSLKEVARAIRKLFVDTPADNVTMVEQIVYLSRRSRIDGILALEKETIRDAKLQKAVLMAVDGMKVEDIRIALEIEMSAMQKRHDDVKKVFDFMASTSPAMGMVGTLIGLIQMLSRMNDPATIGPAMAVAFLTTFYGAMFAFLIFNPLAEKLANKSGEELSSMSIVAQGIEGIVQGTNPTLLYRKLSAWLSPSQVKDITLSRESMREPEHAAAEAEPQIAADKEQKSGT